MSPVGVIVEVVVATVVLVVEAVVGAVDVADVDVTDVEYVVAIPYVAVTMAFEVNVSTVF
jgi:hypothetical protein